MRNSLSPPTLQKTHASLVLLIIFAFVDPHGAANPEL